MFPIPYGGTCSIQWKFLEEPQERVISFSKDWNSDWLQRHLKLQLLKGKVWQHLIPYNFYFDWLLLCSTEFIPFEICGQTEVLGEQLSPLIVCL